MTEDNRISKQEEEQLYRRSRNRSQPATSPIENSDLERNGKTKKKGYNLARTCGYEIHRAFSSSVPLSSRQHSFARSR